MCFRKILWGGGRRPEQSCASKFQAGSERASVHMQRSGCIRGRGERRAAGDAVTEGMRWERAAWRASLRVLGGCPGGHAHAAMEKLEGLCRWEPGSLAWLCIPRHTGLSKELLNGGGFLPLRSQSGACYWFSG